MRLPFFYKKTAVVMAIVVIVLSTATLSYLSYRYTVGGENSLENTLVQQTKGLVEQTVGRIEEKVIDNDRVLYDLVEINERAKWPSISDAIKKNPGLNVDQVWFLKPDGTVLYPPATPEFQASVRQFLNPLAFSVTPQFSLGNCSRNPVRGPSFQDADLAMIKGTRLTERLSLDIRAEVFNLSNTPPLGAPNTTVGSSAFASITTAGDPRVVQLAVKLNF